MGNSNIRIYDTIKDVIKDIDSDSKEVRLLLGVIDYDAPYLLHYNVSLHFKGWCDAKFQFVEFLS